MNIFGIGLPEMAVIAAIALLVFGPKRLPEMGKTLGKTLKGFQSASQEFEKEFRSAIRVEGDDTLTLAPPSPPSAPASGDGVALADELTTPTPPPSA
jgi:sec-independent protein translocase protein TatA